MEIVILRHGDCIDFSSEALLSQAVDRREKLGDVQFDLAVVSWSPYAIRTAEAFMNNMYYIRSVDTLFFPNETSASVVGYCLTGQRPDQRKELELRNSAARALFAVRQMIKQRPYEAAALRVLVVSHAPLIQQMVLRLFPERLILKNVFLRGCQGFRFQYDPQSEKADGLTFLTY